jgi:hypothetical protein
MNALNQKFERPSWDRKASGYKCPVPVIYEFQGEVWQRDCGQCPRCLAAKKKDTSGRAAAEAATSAEVAIWTLTYGTLKDFPDDCTPWVQEVDPEKVAGAKDFIVKHRQDFMKRLRASLWEKSRVEMGAPRKPGRRPKRGRYVIPDEHVRAYWDQSGIKEMWRQKISDATPKVRFIGCGERGEKNTKRVHWHICLFLSKPSGWRPTPWEAPSRRFPKGRRGHEHHALWPFGWVCIDVLPSAPVYKIERGRQIIEVPQAEMSAKMRAIRYCSAYIDKAKVPKIDGLRRPDKAQARFFRSNATPLGFEFLTDLAREHARQALPIKGQYRVPGVVYSKTGAMTVHRLTGRMRDHFIDAYREEWQRLRPDSPVPMTKWMLRYDSEADLEMGFGRQTAAIDWKPRGMVGSTIREETYHSAAWIPLRRWGGTDKGKDLGVIDIHPDGEAEFVDAEGVEHPIERDLREVLPDVSEAQHAFIEGELKRHRGEGWISKRQRRQMVHDLGIARTDAMARWAKLGPNPMPPHLPPIEPVTAMFRKLAMNGYGHVAGRVVRDPHKKFDPGDPFACNKISDGKARPRKPLIRREV